MVLTGLHLVYLDKAGEQLLSVSVTGASPSTTLRLPAPATTLTPVIGAADTTLVRVDHRLVSITIDKLTLLDTQLQADSSVAIHSHTADHNILLTLQRDGKVIRTVDFLTSPTST